MTVQELVIAIGQALVDDTESVSVEVVPDSDDTLLRLSVAPKDIGKIIGTQGRTARALRTILAVVGTAQRHRYSLDIVE